MTQEIPQSFRDQVYQEFKLASSGHYGRIARPEGIGLVITMGDRSVNLFGHTKRGLSAAGDALKTLNEFTGGQADQNSHRITFVLAAVGLDTKKGSMMLPSPKLLKDLQAYIGTDLSTIDVFAPHGDSSHDYTYKLPAPKAGRG